MNTQAIITGTRDHFSSEGREAELEDKIQKQKNDIISEYRSWKQKNPDRSFDDFKNHSIDELKSGMEYLNEILVIGIFITALDKINPDQDL
jgi:hypothetical protein